MKPLKTLLKLFIPLLLLLLVFAWLQQRALRLQIEVSPEQNVLEVKRGESFQHVLLRLEKNYDFSGRQWVKLYCKLSRQCDGIKQGEYILPATTSIQQLLLMMKKGDVKQYKFTIVEGWRTVDMLRAIKELPNIEHQLLSVDATELMALLGKPDMHPEGMFLAETYFYKKGDSDLELLKRAHVALEKALEKAWQSRIVGLPYDNSYQALIMASIVEKETALAEERPQIAGVFIRRLQQNWKLQTDPTIIYGLGADFDGNIRRKHLKQRTPYNTYVIDGLPPTPIALVGEEALAAAVNPDDGESMYFVARGDGSHQFSETLEEHEAAVDEYQRYQRKDNYRSYPHH